MDLSSLLNTQKEVILSFQDIKDLRADPDSAVIVDKIRSFTAFDYPQSKSDSFVFFDTFIQLLLFIDLEDDPYGAQYTKSIMISAFRKCINGLLLQHGNGWLVEFPSHFTATTWVAMRKHNDATILVYLYGLVLTRANEEVSEKWLHSLLQFMQSAYVGAIVNLWLTCCCTLEDNDQIGSDYAQAAFLRMFEQRLVREPQVFAKIAEKTLHILKSLDTAYLRIHIDQFLGSALGRDVFTKDDFTMGYMQLQNKCENKSNVYPRFKKMYILHKEQHANPKESINPLLLSPALLETWSTDKYEQAKSIREGSLFWIKKIGELTPAEFDVNLKKVILQQYPTDKKTVLDRLLADWTARDRFHRHLEYVANIMMDLLANKPYNKRSAPYYAFVQIFNIPDEHHQRHADHYETKSGAYIDLSQYRNCSDQPLMKGCCQLLKSVTQSRASPHVVEWVGDCLHNASVEIVKHYFTWLVEGFNKEILEKTNSPPPPRFEPFLKVALKSCQSKSVYIVPILLKQFNYESLEWLLKENKPSAQALLHYFDDGPQISKHLMVQGLFKNKKVEYVNLLLTFLRDSMVVTDPQLFRSRSWFKNHFLGVILSLVGEDTTGQGVASCIFRQLFKTRDDFEWYFATALVNAEEKLNYKALHFANLHDVFDIKETGLAAVFHEMVRLKDTGKKKRVIKVWKDLWTSGSKITVPVSWVLHCAGLYDQAPVLVKQMIKELVTIGLEQDQEQEEGQRMISATPERSFADRIMDVVLLSDAPEPENLFELILNVSKRETVYQEVKQAIINILIELSEELEVELMASDSAIEPKPKGDRVIGKVSKEKRQVSRKKMKRIIMMHAVSVEHAKEEKNDTPKTITTLVQRVFNFLLPLLTNTSYVVDEVNTSLLRKQEIRNELITAPLMYKPLSKLLRLIQEPEDLLEDVQSTVDMCMEYLKKRPDVYDISQKILVL